MTRLLKLATIIFAIISLTSAQFVDTLNTPLGPVTQGAKVAVSWTLLAGADATGKTGDLSATDSATKNVIDIDPAVPLAPKTYLWNVQVPPGTYVLGLNDGSGLKQSGEVVVKAPPGGAAPAPAPSGGAAPAPAPPGGAAPAPPPPGGAAPPASSSPAGGAATPSSASNSTAGGAGGSTGGAGGSTSGAGGSTGGSGGAGGSTGGSGSSNPAPISSASSIFSGYGFVFGLLSVAIAMVQF